MPREPGSEADSLSPRGGPQEKLASPRGALAAAAEAPETGLVLAPKNVQSMRTLFNIAHRLSNVLGPAWGLVLETMNTLVRRAGGQVLWCRQGGGRFCDAGREGARCCGAGSTLSAGCFWPI